MSASIILLFYKESDIGDSNASFFLKLFLKQNGFTM